MNPFDAHTVTFTHGYVLYADKHGRAIAWLPERYDRLLRRAWA